MFTYVLDYKIWFNYLQIGQCYAKGATSQYLPTDIYISLHIYK